MTAKERAELLRQTVDTIGKPGQPGEQIQNVISVGMLSEGWDAKTVTHIMGLRAFTSQLLCEQVVGRGLRRTAYDVNPKNGLLDPEYVNIFGIPFTFLPHESQGDGPPKPPIPKTAIEPSADKAEFEIRWPNLIRIEHVYRPRLELDLDEVSHWNWMPARLHSLLTSHQLWTANRMSRTLRTLISTLWRMSIVHRGSYSRLHVMFSTRCNPVGQEAAPSSSRSLYGWSNSSLLLTGSQSRRRCSTKMNCDVASLSP